MKGLVKYGISYKCEFKDKKLETEFFNSDLAKSVYYTKPITFSLGILFMLFIIPDYFLIHNRQTLLIIFIIRAAFLVLIFAISYSFDKVKNYNLHAILASACEIFAAICFLAIYCFYDSPDFLIQTMGVIVILVGIYMTPNKWIYLNIVSGLISLSFFLISFYFMSRIEFLDFSAGIVYVIIVMVLSSIASFWSNYLKRIQYIDSRELLKMSYTDPLTGSYNRAKFDQELTEWMEYSNRYNTPLSIAIFDIDNFKKINDLHGHLSGDIVMQEVVGIIRSVVRKQDVFARWGGDEFAILLPCTENDQAAELTERLRKLIEEYSFSVNEKVTCSFGLGTMVCDETADDFLRRADKLLYKAKKSGKNTIRYNLKKVGIKA
jgi:two-component system cell cycle response regulator